MPTHTPTELAQPHLDWAQDRIQQCRLYHDRCNASRPRQRPKRLVDLSNLSGGEVRIVEADSTERNSCGDKPEYVCLSYCWGTAGQFQLLRDGCEGENYDSLVTNKRPLAVAKLPLNFQQVMPVIVELGFRYVWIDALCIIQDSDTDKETEIHRMRHIYEGSALNLALAGAQDCHDGCLPLKPVEPTTIITHFAFSLRSKPNLTEFAYGIRDTNEEEKFLREVQQPSDFPLVTRGWALQEILLSPRVLFIGRHELLWCCLERTTCECKNELFPWSLQLKMALHGIQPRAAECSTNISERVLSDYNIWGVWWEILWTYSICRLSQPEDREAAIYGIADKLLGERISSSYFAGLWTDPDYIDLALLWVSFKTVRTDDRSGNSPYSRNSKWPTWSWCSACPGLGAVVIYDDIPSKWKAPTIKVRRPKTLEIQSIVLTAWWEGIQVLGDYLLGQEIAEGLDIPLTDGWTRRITRFVPDATELETVKPAQEITLVVIRVGDTGLINGLVLTKKIDRNVYQRIGCIELSIGLLEETGTNQSIPEDGFVCFLEEFRVPRLISIE